MLTDNKITIKKGGFGHMANSTSSKKIMYNDNGAWEEKITEAKTVGELKVELNIPDNTIIQITSGVGDDATDVALSNNTDLLPDGGDNPMYVAWQTNNKTGGKK
jgi:hypothetical protein|tara:strand:- start:2186 stop:2497 length:312 start_codon:yes stop_codon:yes gene_type:complete